MSKCRLFIVRHAQTVGNLEKRLTGMHDYEITEEGKRSIELLTKKLENINFDAIYSSPEARAKKTIEPLAIINNIQIIEKRDLCEMYFGIYDGWKWEDVNKIAPQIKKNQILTNEIYGIPEQETMEEVAERMYNCIKDICIENEGKTILIGSHGVAIEAFLRKIEGIPFSEQRERFCQHNTAINEVVYENDKFNIIKLADISHITLNY